MCNFKYSAVPLSFTSFAEYRHAILWKHYVMALSGNVFFNHPKGHGGNMWFFNFFFLEFEIVCFLSFVWRWSNSVSRRFVILNRTVHTQSVIFRWTDFAGIPSPPFSESGKTQSWLKTDKRVFKISSHDFWHRLGVLSPTGTRAWPHQRRLTIFPFEIRSRL